MCLRVADVLEVDPERTPDVILHHRDVAEKSLPYWHKDRFITIAIENNEVVFHATPTEAYLHKAIEDTANQIEAEIGLCYSLIADKPLNYIKPSHSLKHNWTLKPKLQRDIKPIEESYEYIEGTFRPNTSKILELLAGTSLYNEPILAVRELLQNAFDATKEQMAYRRLINSMSEEEAALLRRQYKVQLVLEQDGKDYWLSCTDNGVGMTKDIITRYFLVSGASRRHQIADLERRCRQAGFELERTGQFGIGVLSFFMIAEKVIIYTKRSQETGDNDLNGHEFQINGLQEFGELRKRNKSTVGTEVRLLLRPDIIEAEEGIDNWTRKLLNMLEHVLVKIPCAFSFASKITPHANWQLQPGWCYKQDYFAEKLREDFEKKIETDRLVIDTLLPADEQEAMHKAEAARQAIRKKIIADFGQRLRWHVHEGTLPNNLGYFRLHLPYFALEEGNSIAYMHIERKDQQLHV
jgi:hypothetical protein